MAPGPSSPLIIHMLSGLQVNNSMPPSRIYSILLSVSVSILGSVDFERNKDIALSFSSAIPNQLFSVKSSQ